jgi:hypothetical protein
MPGLTDDLAESPQGLGGSSQERASFSSTGGRAGRAEESTFGHAEASPHLDHPATVRAAIELWSIAQERDNVELKGLQASIAGVSRFPTLTGIQETPQHLEQALVGILLG